MFAFIVPLEGGGGSPSLPIHLPPGTWPPKPPGYGGGVPTLPIALPPQMWPKPPGPPNEVAPPIFLPDGGVVTPPIQLPGGIVVPPIYYPPSLWPNPPGPSLPGLPQNKALVAIFTARSGWHAALVDIPPEPPTSGPK